MEIMGVIGNMFRLVRDIWHDYRSRINRRRRLARAVYHHAAFAERLFDEFLKGYDSLERRITAEGSTFTPFTVPSPTNDLTYEQIIEVMDWLEGEGQEKVLGYYHYQMIFHATALSFNSEYARELSQDRKRRLLEMCKTSAQDAMRDAKCTMEVLEAKLK